MSISEIKVGTIVKVKVGRNIVPAKVVEVLEDGFRVSSIAKNKEFIVTASRIVVDAQKIEPIKAPEPAEPEPVEEFQPSGDDQEDEYVINPAHESDKPAKRMSMLSAAVEVLKAAGPEHPMNCKEILEVIFERQLWTPTECKTPEQTLYGSIFREIATKEHPRIVRADQKGKFRIAE